MPDTTISPSPRRRRPKTQLPAVLEDVPHETRFGCDGRARVTFSPERKRWSGAVETEFLNCLASSGNVVWSAKAAGISPGVAWYHRRKKPAFAQLWTAALDQAFTMLEFEMVASARSALSDIEFPSELKIKPMSAADAIRVLSVYKGSLKRDGRRGGFVPLPASMEDVRDDILRKIKAIRNARRARG